MSTKTPVLSRVAVEFTLDPDIVWDTNQECWEDPNTSSVTTTFDLLGVGALVMNETIREVAASHKLEL